MYDAVVTYQCNEGYILYCVDEYEKDDENQCNSMLCVCVFMIHPIYNHRYPIRIYISPTEITDATDSGYHVYQSLTVITAVMASVLSTWLIDLTN